MYICKGLEAQYVGVQEVTSNIYSLLSHQTWWKQYVASPAERVSYFTSLLYRKDAFKCTQHQHEIPFANSIMGKLLRCCT